MFLGVLVCVTTRTLADTSKNTKAIHTPCKRMYVSCCVTTRTLTDASKNIKAVYTRCKRMYVS